MLNSNQESKESWLFKPLLSCFISTKDINTSQKLSAKDTLVFLSLFVDIRQTSQGTFVSVVRTQSNQICWPTKSSPYTSSVSTQWGPWESLAPSLMSLYLPVEYKYLNQWSICVAVLSIFPYRLLKWKLFGRFPFSYILNTRHDKYLDSGEEFIKNLKLYYAEKKIIWKDCFKTDTHHNLYPILIGLWYHPCVYNACQLLNTHLDFGRWMVSILKQKWF